MPDFASNVPASHQNVSPGFLETLIQARREELFTGLMRLGHLSGENFLFSFLEGTQQRLYRCQNNAVEIIPREVWQRASEHNCASVGFMPLSMEAMRFTKVVHETPVRQIEEATLGCEELANAVRKWATEQGPGVVHIEGDNINRYYLMAGASTPVIEELALLGGESRVFLNDASFPKTLPPFAYHVLRYVSVEGHDVWREHELRLAFYPFMRMLLNRFGELAGRILTERLCERLSAWSRQQGWNVSLTSNGIVNRQYFNSLENAISFYTDLIQRFNAETRPALGSGMTEGIQQEILMKLDSHRRELLTESIFHRLGVGSETGMVWR